MSRILFCGSRTWTNEEAIAWALKDCDVCCDTIVVGYDPMKRTPRGADRITYDMATLLGFEVEPHPADWDTLGRGAGFARNIEMLKTLRPGTTDRVYAFWDGTSHGTKHTMDWAKRLGIDVNVYTEHRDFPVGNSRRNTHIE